MKKNLTLLVLLFLMGMPVMSQQDSVTSLIFTEYYGRSPGDAYYELTNMGDTALTLSNFWLGIVPGWAQATCFDWTGSIPKIIPNASNWGRRLPGIKLEPGQHILVNNVYDAPGGAGNEVDWRRWTWNRPEFLNADVYIPVHWNETGMHEFWDRPDLQMFGFDSICNYDWACDLWSGLGATVLFYVYPGGTDSVLVDQVNLAKNPAGDNLSQNPSDVAGVTQATWDHILVRKANIRKGNTNWDQSRGVDKEDSEWMTLFSYNKGLQGQFRNRPYTTVGTHGDFHINLSSNTITIDNANNKLTVPWGILKNDSILNEFVIGPGMAWIYTENDQSFADSAFSTVQNGDEILFMACGNNYEEKNYTIQVSAPATDMALVFPKRSLRYDAIASENFNGQYWGGTPYYVTQKVPGMDSICNVPYGTRIDTLLTYLEKAPKANWKIEYVDGLERVDVKLGDKLIVTAENGTTTKEYYIAVRPLVKNENASLSAITWPDKPYYMDGWQGDTIPGFSPAATVYQVMLPYGTKSVPAFIPTPQDIKAKIVMHRASSLSGSQVERTTTFTVTSENDSLTTVYSVLFSVEKRPEDVQLYKAEPFISEMTGSKCHYYEFVNVGDVPLDMSKYLFAWTSKANVTPADVIKNIGAATDLYNFTTRYGKGYVPGYKFSDDTLEWQANPAKLYFDAKVNPVVNPGDVFVLGNPIQTKWVSATANANSDVITNYGSVWLAQLGVNLNTWGLTNLVDNLQMGMHWTALYLFRIENDSILEGTKAVNADPNDYTLIDMVGDPGISRWQDMWIGEHQRTDWSYVLSMRRKPNIYQGITEADSTTNRNDWVSTAKSDAGFTGDVYQWVGSHTFDPVTAHKSTVSSLLYLVSVGYSGVQSIQGDLNATTLATFYSNISKADEGQTLSVINGTNGSIKGLTDNMADKDTLMVVSANGKNTTKYLISNLPLDDNAVITAKDNSGITIEIDGANGLIKGVDYGSVLKLAMGNLVIPTLANASIIDQNGDLVPFKRLNYDTIMVDTKIGNSVYIEVIAQNGINKITYRFDPAAVSSDAFVISTLYGVDQDNSIISDIALGTSAELFWKNIEVVKGATATLVDKAGFERKEGNMNYDDKLVVVSEDQSVTNVYYLNFLGENNPDGNIAPSVSVTATDVTITGVLDLVVTATAGDDGLPFGSVLTSAWKVIEGNAAGVSFEDAAALSTKVTFTGTGKYKLQITVTDGEKIATATINVTVLPAVGIASNKFSPRIYPNPVSDVLTIEMDNFVGRATKITISDITGKTIYVNKDSNTSTVIDVRKFEPGIYFVTVSSGQEIVTNKISVVR